MPTDIQPADRRMRTVTAIVLALAVIVAITFLFAFQHWLTALASRLPAEQFVALLRHGIGVVTLAIGLCVLLLGGYAVRLARFVIAERRWPLAATRVLRDTPIRRDAAATKIARWLTAAGVALLLIAVATMLVSWRLFSVGH